MAENLRATYESRVAAESTGFRKILALQKRFGVSDGLPVHLKGRNDNRMYRGVMIGSLVGIAITLGSIYMMATGTMPKKER